MSNLTTNESTDDETEYFKFEDEFSSALECFSVPYTKADNVIRWIVSFDPPTNESEHIINDENGQKIVTTTGGVCIAKVSFKVLSDDFDMSGFALQEDTSSPTTGIKINLNITNAYENQSTFRFKDATASKNADLSNLIVSSGQIDELDPSKSTYKEYEITPSFDKDTLSYQMELLEYLDEIDIKPVLDDTKSTIKIKVPKRSEDGNLEYDTDGITVIYEEKELENDVASSVTLNKLGEPDTHITIIVTAEDNKTTKSYNLIIKRPYGTIKGKILTYNTDDIHLSTVKLFKNGAFDWNDYYTVFNDIYTHDDLPNCLDYIETEEDGTFSIKVIPGVYDIMIDKNCYFDYILTSKTLAEGEIKDIGTINLIPGDINKDGIIDAKDFNNVKLYFGKDFEQADIDESGTIDAPDFNAIKLRFGKSMEIY